EIDARAAVFAVDRLVMIDARRLSMDRFQLEADLAVQIDHVPDTTTLTIAPDCESVSFAWCDGAIRLAGRDVFRIKGHATKSRRVVILGVAGRCVSITGGFQSTAENGDRIELILDADGITGVIRDSADMPSDETGLNGEEPDARISGKPVLIDPPESADAI